jgi:hypothetical protein
LLTFRHRQGDPYPDPPKGRVERFYRPFMGLDDVAADGKAKTGPTGGPVTRFFHPVETIKQLPPLFFRNAGATILEIDGYPPIRRFERYVERPAGIGIFLRIVQQVVEELRLSFGIGKDGNSARWHIQMERQLLFCQFGPSTVDRFGKDLRQVYRTLPISKGAHIGKRQLVQIINQFASVRYPRITPRQSDGRTTSS